MTYVDLSFLGTGIGLIIAFWFFGLCISVVLGIFNKFMKISVAFFFVYFCSVGGVQAADFIVVPDSIDWSAVFFDIVSLIAPFGVIALCFGAFQIIRKSLGFVR